MPQSHAGMGLAGTEITTLDPFIGTRVASTSWMAHLFELEE
jgi:hypothetical protein